MDTKFLTYFVEIAHCRNLSKAATYLFVTQSTLSQFIAREEKELGVQLFIRDKKELKLTYAGECYLAACQRMLKEKDHLYHTLADLKLSRTGITRLGITPQWGGMILSAILPAFTTAFPNSSLKITEDIAHPLLENITSGNLDLALVALNEAVPSQLPSISIHKEELVIAMPYSLIGVRQDYNNVHRHLPVIDLHSLKDKKFILSKERTIIRDITNNMFRSANFVPHVVCEINNHVASLAMTASGIGISIIPQTYMSPNRDICYFSVKPHWYWDISVIRRRDYDLSPADKYLVELLKNYYAQFS